MEDMKNDNLEQHVNKSPYENGSEEDKEDKEDEEGFDNGNPPLTNTNVDPWQQIAYLNGVINALTQQHQETINTLKATHTSSSQTVKDIFEKQIATLKEDHAKGIEGLKSKYKTLKNQSKNPDSSQETEIRRKNDYIEQLEAKNLELENQCRQWQIQITQWGSQNVDLNKHNTNLSKCLEEEQKSKNILISSLHELEERYGELEKSLTKAEEDKKDLTRDLAGLQSHSMQLQKEFFTLENTLKELKAENTILQQSNKALKENKGQKAKTVTENPSDFLDRIKVLEFDLEKSKKQYFDLQNSNAERNKKLAELNQSHLRLTKEASDLKKEKTGTLVLSLINHQTKTSVDGWFLNIFPLQYFTTIKNENFEVEFPFTVPNDYSDSFDLVLVARVGKIKDSIGFVISTNKVIPFGKKS
jgi:myosin heavy subunit